MDNMKIWLTLLSIVVVAITTISVKQLFAGEEGIKFPKAQFDRSEFDFKSAPEGKTVVHDFVVKNRGNGTLLIKGVKTGCGCTTVHYDKEISPGKEGRIQIKVNTTGYSGSAINKEVKVFTNDPENLIIDLKIFGMVEDLVSISPRTVRLAGNVSEEIRMGVKITPTAKYPLSIKSLKVDEGTNIEAQLIPSDSPAGSFDLIVKNIRERGGRYFDRIILTTDSDIEPEIKINVFGNVTE